MLPMEIKLMTLNECARYLREHGFPIGAAALADGIAEGVFPFGDLLPGNHKPGKKRRNFRIYAAKVEAWAREMAGEDGEENA